MGKLKILLIDSRNNKPIAFILINFVLFLKKTYLSSDR